MNQDVQTIVGLVGTTLILTTGKIFESIRDWLRGFEHPWNPLRWLGDLMGCSMCAGWWVGFGWGMLHEHSGWMLAGLLGGATSFWSFLADEALGIIAGWGMRVARSLRPPQQVRRTTPPPLPPKRDPIDRAMEEEEDDE